MPQELITSTHPTYRKVVERVRQGAYNRDIMAEFGVTRWVVLRARKTVGIPSPRRRVPTVDERISAHLTAPDAAGHRVWTGPVQKTVPVVKSPDGRAVFVPRVLFERRVQRAAVGNVRTECGTDLCLQPYHLSDVIERRDLRGCERAVYGLDPQPWDVCPAGIHDWTRHGRFMPDLEAYCGGCNTQRASRNRRAKDRKEAS